MSILNRLIVMPLNHLLERAPWAAERLRQHTGGVVRIQGGGVAVSMQIDSDGYLRAFEGAKPPDVCIDLPADFLLRAAVDRNSLMSAARLSGMADLAETFAFVFRNLRWDVEADLAQLFGDIPARRLADNLSEYATEDSGLLASPSLLKAFVGEVDVLRDDLARLEKRLQHLGA
jgi:ubiquinone biosynthesis protein UbiJ